MVPVRNGTWHGSSGKYYYDISLQIKRTKDEPTCLRSLDVNEPAHAREGGGGQIYTEIDIHIIIDTLIRAHEDEHQTVEYFSFLEQWHADIEVLLLSMLIDSRY